MPFLNRLITIGYAPDGEIQDGEFVVHSPLRYMSRSGLVLIVEEGFITDFASIPVLVRLIPWFSVNGRSRAPAVLHDRAYCGNGEMTGTFSKLSRKECDQLFREALISVGVPATVAWAMYAGVRSGGWYYWGKRKSGPTSEDFATFKEIKESEKAA